MQEPGQIDFWFTMGSTYTYLTVMRINQVQRSHGVVFRWRPFYLLTILKEMKHVPFADKPNKMAYMWRDIERRAALRGIPFNRAAPYPLRNSTLANRVALVGLQEGWGEDFIRASYRRWFLCNEETGSEPNLSNSLDEAGQDRLRVCHQSRQRRDIGHTCGRDGRRAWTRDLRLSHLCLRAGNLLGRRSARGCRQLVPSITALACRVSLPSLQRELDNRQPVRQPQAPRFMARCRALPEDQIGSATPITALP
jgi:2-hydroxychromene-2-carboxylate isomerase